jgi:hypothetical protein
MSLPRGEVQELQTILRNLSQIPRILGTRVYFQKVSQGSGLALLRLLIIDVLQEIFVMVNTTEDKVQGKFILPL